jgi:hypothetical protein
MKKLQKIVSIDEQLHQKLLVLKASRGFKSLSETIKYFVDTAVEGG